MTKIPHTSTYLPTKKLSKNELVDGVMKKYYSTTPSQFELSPNYKSTLVQYNENLNKNQVNLGHLCSIIVNDKHREMLKSANVNTLTFFDDDKFNFALLGKSTDGKLKSRFGNGKIPENKTRKEFIKDKILNENNIKAFEITTNVKNTNKARKSLIYDENSNTITTYYFDSKKVEVLSSPCKNQEKFNELLLKTIDETENINIVDIYKTDFFTEIK